MKVRNVLGMIGIFVALVGVALLLSRAQAAANARARDARDVGEPLGEDTQERLLCERSLVSADLSARVMSEDDEQTLTVVVGNQSNATACVIHVEVAALRFAISPTTLQRTTAELAPGATETYVWLIAPLRAGDHTIIVTANEALQTLGVTVRTWLGLTAGQARVASFVATLLGPLLTVPWWLERWEKRSGTAAKPTTPTAE